MPRLYRIQLSITKDGIRNSDVEICPYLFSSLHYSGPTVWNTTVQHLLYIPVHPGLLHSSLVASHLVSSESIQRYSTRISSYNNFFWILANRTTNIASSSSCAVAGIPSSPTRPSFNQITSLTLSGSLLAFASARSRRAYHLHSVPEYAQWTLFPVDFNSRLLETRREPFFESAGWARPWIGWCYATSCTECLLWTFPCAPLIPESCHVHAHLCMLVLFNYFWFLH